MDSVLKQSMALAASQGKCHMVAAGDWNMEESAVTSVMHARPALAIGRPSYVPHASRGRWKWPTTSSTRPWWRNCSQTHNRSRQPQRGTISESALHTALQMVARFRARAARRGEEARLAAETMGEELARQSENLGTRQEEEVLDWERKVEAKHERVESDTEAQKDAKPPSEDDDEKNLGDD